MSPLSSEVLSEIDRRSLLEFARLAITERIAQRREWFPGNVVGAIAELRGVFVTLHRRGRLRGCIGQPAASDPLAIAVTHCAVAAALKDPRFEPVEPRELSDLHIEISVLSPLERLDPTQIEIGIHGLHVSQGAIRGLLLPQVPVGHHWDSLRFLQETCCKAGLPPDAWKSPETLVQGFTAEVFSDGGSTDSIASADSTSSSALT